MKIYDCFSYWDEDLLLDVRLNIMDKFVDYFVIVEGNKTWQNNHKNHNFDISKFQKFKDKIIYIKVTDMPDGDNPYLRENYQRNCISRGIEMAENDDFVRKALNEFQRILRLSGPAASASYSLLGSIIIFSMGGYALDNHFLTFPLFLLVGLLLGLIVGFYGLYKFINK